MQPADILRRDFATIFEIYGMTEGGGACMLEAHKYRETAPAKY
jgi:hypothetical protein